jgi:diguanylate cyclase (GGDEF)-like protein
LAEWLAPPSADCVIATDAAGRIVEWSPAAERTFGHTRERAIGADLADLIAPAADRERRRSALTAMGYQVVRHAPLEELGIAVAVLAREELGADVARIWQSHSADAPLELVASAGSADDERHGPPPMPASDFDLLEIPGGLAYGASIPGGPVTAIALHSEAPIRRREEDLQLLGSLCQILVSSISHHSTVERVEQAELRYHEAEEDLRYAVDYDELTGLANRRRFADELRRRRGEGNRGALAVLDLDDLKYVNDSLGHAAGDAVLRTVSKALSEVLRPGEFIARFGGDEFTVLLDVSTEKVVRRRLAAFLRAVRAHDARMSVGVVMFDAEGNATDEDLLIAADIAMHAAKERGGDRYEVFTGTGTERLAWVGHLREAIDSDRLALHHQPIFDLADRMPAADEILVRMLEPDGSVLPPAAFLPTAERFGLIREIDRWVIAHAIEAAAPDGPITINVSARSTSDPALPHHIHAALERSGADPANVVFEITETAAATAGEELRAFGARIERLGCALAIDDFGTGFGSLTYLKHLPVRYLKIDMEFVRGINESAADRAIVQSIVTIAKSLGMQTIGEGVEDEETLQRLTDLGVDFAQGYHLGRPVALAS